MKATLILVGTIIAVCGLTTATSKNVSDLSDLERATQASELYLQDQQDYEEHCPFRTWEQPSLEVYRDTLTSHLPEGCIKEK
jgi:hypothetical protein